MYDKSKKTWSQRLKIHRNDKSELSLNTAASVTSTQTPHSPSSTGHSSASPLEGSVANVGHHNVSIRSAIPAHYQITPAAAIMHLPTHLPMSDYHHGGGMGAAYDYMTGRSMKYAEPWIYGTVRGIPARPAAGLYHPAYAAAYAAGHRHAAAIFAAPTDMPTATPAVAVVLCSCHEYLSGTKGRTLKKASVCKKCKGTRLPLANIGGTVRVPSNIHTAKLRPVGASATVRVVSSTKKQRPTILDPQMDPYDLMRRTRLLSPEPGNMSKPSGSGNKDKSRSRGKSASPVRGRSRTRQHQKALLPASSVIDSAKLNEAVDDSWLTEGEALAQTSSASHSRKSILRCNVNPYDLISINAQGSSGSPGESYTTNPTASPSTPSAGGDSSKKSIRRQKLQFSQNEFMPPSDEFNVQDAALAEDEPPFIRHTTSVTGGENHKQEAHAKTEEISHKAQTTTQQRKSKKPNYSNVQAIAGQRISLGAEQQTSKSLIQQSADGTSTYESFSMESGPSKPREADSVNKATRPDTLPVQPAPTTEAEPKRPPRANKQQQQFVETKETKTKEIPDEEEITVTVTVTPTYNIKSILKRPSSKSSEGGDTSQQTDGHSTASIPSTPMLRDAESKADTPTNSRRHQPTTSSPATTAQFYIPLPQMRKKVQFMVEDSEEGDALNEDDSDTDGSGNSTSGDLGTNYEYYNRKRNQKKLLIEEDPAEYASQAEPESDGHVVTYDEQFIQAMLLEKLQLDSELVTKRQQEQEHNTTTLHINEDEKQEDQSTADDIATQIIKTNYGDAISCPIQPTDFALTADNATNAGTATTDTTRMSTKHQQQQQQQYEHEHEHDQIPNTIRPTKTAIAPFGTATTSMQLSSSPHVVGPIQNVTDMRDTAGDSDDEDLPAQDKSTVVSIESVDNGHDGLADDDGDDSDAATSGNGDYDDDSGNNDATLSHEVLSNDDGYENKNASSVVTTASSMDTNVQVAFGQAGDNNQDDGAVNVSSPSPASKAQHYGVTKSTTSPAVPTISSGVCNDQVGDDATSTCGPEEDDVKSKQQQQRHHHHHPQQQLQRQQKELPKCNKKKMNKKDMQTSLAAPGTTDSTGEASGSTDIVGRKLTKETQSRNPIRRSQSERQPSSMTYQQHSNSNRNNNNSNKFKTDARAGNDDDGGEKSVQGSRNIKPNASNGLKDTSATNKINDGSGNNNNSELNFHDTMALRKRSNRSDARDLFTMGGHIGRPREPPPPPPPSSGQVAKEEAATAALKASAHLAKSSEVITAEADAIESTYQRTVNGLESKQQKTTIGQANNGSSSSLEINGSNTTRVVNDISVQQEQSGHSKKLINTVNATRHVTNDNKSPVGIFNSSPTGGKQQQRTVVRVAPFNKTPPAFEVHRLKITHTDHGNDELLTPTTPKTPTTPGFAHSSHYSVTDLSTLSPAHDYGQQKTSILINGDDCYSTMNLSCDEYATPLYQSSVVVTDGPSKDLEGLRMTNSFNTVTINVSSPRSSEDELIHQHNQLNNLLKRQAKSSSGVGSIRAIIPIRGTIDVNLQRSASSTSSASTSSMTSTCSSTSSSTGCTSKRGKTLIRLDYDKEKTANVDTITAMSFDKVPPSTSEWLPHETELLKILRNPVEAVKRNLVPHICKLREDDNQKDSKRSKKMKDGLKETPADLQESLALTPSLRSPMNSSSKPAEANSFIGKLLEDPMLNQVAEGLESETVAELIENSLKRLQESRSGLDMTGTKDKDDMNRLIDLSLKRIQEERYKDHNTTTNSATTTAPTNNGNLLTVPLTKDEERLSNRGSISSANSFASAHNYELFDFDAANESDCYQSCSSEINSLLEDDVGSAETKSKFYQMLVDATLQEIELSTNTEDLNIEEEHQYESIRHNIDPIYEEISDMPPPLPLTAPPLNDPELEKKSARSIFEGASKYDILSYLVDAKERGVVKEEPFDYPLNCSNPIIIEEESSDTLSDLGKLSKLKRLDTISSRSSILSDSSEDNQSTMSSLSPPAANNFMLLRNKQAAIDIERNDSGVGSETSKTSRSKFLNPSHNSSITSSFSSTTSSSHSPQPRSSPLHLCEDCDGAVETQLGEDGIMFAPLVCRKCGKKRVERKEIITEVVETEEKYGRDLQIILEEFCHPMLVAGLLTQEQLSAIFLNTEELLENNQTLAERMRDALDIALEQGDDDLLTVNIGKIFLESTQMLHAFESYCVRQAGSSLLLANLEKDKELLRIFLKVSQMENAVLRRMNLNSFLMVPVQRVTKYPLLLARLYKVTPAHLEGRDLLKQAQEKIELHLNHINQEAKDVPTKLWRRISSSSPNRRASCEIDMINIKLRKMAIDVLEWNHDEVRFVMEGKLLYTQPTDSNWKKARTIKLTSVNALLVTNGKPSTNYKAEKVMSDKLNFPKHTGIREASLLVVKEKCGRYALIREPLYLDRCVVCSEADWDEYFEIQEISSKDTFIFKAEDNVRTKQWYTQLQYHAQGMGAWRKRRNALANIMINGMLTRS